MKNNDDILRELSPTKEKEKYRWDVYGVNTYNPCVKVTNWWYHREGSPEDDDVYNTSRGCGSSCKRPLTEDENLWKSETIDSMRRGLDGESLAMLIKNSQPRPMLTFLSYPRTQKARKDLLNDEIRLILPSLPKALMKLRYSTTYNSSYKWIQAIPDK